MEIFLSSKAAQSHSQTICVSPQTLSNQTPFKLALLFVGLKITSYPLLLLAASVQPFVNRKDTGKNSPENCHQKKLTVNIALNTQYFCKSHHYLTAQNLSYMQLITSSKSDLSNWIRL